MVADGLTMNSVSSGYGPTVVIDNVSLAIAPGETVALLGRNGVGKTTLLATLMGHTTVHAGDIGFNGKTITAWPIWKRSHAGLGLVPQERDIFKSLSVDENLGVARRGTAWSADHVYQLFPRLRERRKNRGNQLSGGEQQMLAIGRALMASPRFLLLDEPLEGLAPVIVDLIFKSLVGLREQNVFGIVLVEQRAILALRFARRAIVLDRGKITFDGESKELLSDPARLASLIGASGKPRPKNLQHKLSEINDDICNQSEVEKQ